MEVKRHKNGSKEADPDQPNTWEGGIPIVVPGFPPPGQPNLSTGQPRCWEELGRLESWELGSQKIKRREKCDFPLVFKPMSLVRSFMPPYYKYTSSCLFATKPSPFSWSPLCRTSLPCPSHCRKPLQAKKKKPASFIPQGSASPPCFPSHYSAWRSPRSGIHLGTAETSRR